MLASNAAESDFRLLADNAPVMIWRSGVDMLCDWFNKPWLDFTGRSMEEEIGAGWVQNLHPQDFERCLRTYAEAFETRAPFSMEYRLRRHDGEYRWLLDNGKPYWRGGEFAGYFGSCIDVSRHRETETRLEQALETRELLLREVHHRVRNNLQNLTSLIRILAKESGGGGESKWLLDSLDRRIHAMAAIQFALHDADAVPTLSTRRFMALLLMSFADAHPATRAEVVDGDGDCEVGMSEAPHLGLAIFETLLLLSSSEPRDGRIVLTDRAGRECLRVEITAVGHLPHNAIGNHFDNAPIAERLAKLYAQSAGFSLALTRDVFGAQTAWLTRL